MAPRNTFSYTLCTVLLLLSMWINPCTAAKASNNSTPVLDTVLSASFFFDPSRWAMPGFMGTGAFGTARMDLFPNHSSKGFVNYGFNAFAYYRFKDPNYPSTDSVGTRNTEINYHLGNRKEQHVDFDHMQHIRPGLHVGLSIGAHTTPGDFSRQLSSGRRFRIHAALKDSASRYQFETAYRFFRISNEENGGVTSDSAFEQATSLDTRTLPIFLDNASVIQRENQYDLKHSISFIKPRQDGLGIAAYHRFDYVRTSFVFQSLNPDSGYFSNFWIDSTSTYDSSFFDRMQNEMGALMVRGFGTARLEAKFGFLLEQSTYTIAGFEKLHRNTDGLVGEIGLSLKDSIQISAGWTQAVSGATDQWQAHASINAKFRKLGHAALTLSSQSLKPSLFAEYYISNHFAWINGFDNEKRSTIRMCHSIDKLRLQYGLDLSLVKGVVFFREDQLPQQFSKQLAYGRSYVKKGFRFGKFGSDQQLVYSFTGNDNVVSLPAITYFGSLYYRSMFFKNALDLRCGFDATVWSAYASYGYMPATAVFYLQDTRKTGGFPMLGLFADMIIKSAVITLRLDHFNAGMGTREYYGSWRYPLQGRTLKIGVRWILSD